MYLFNKIVDFLAFLCRVSMVTPETINAQRPKREPVVDRGKAEAVRFRFR